MIYSAAFSVNVLLDEMTELLMANWCILCRLICPKLVDDKFQTNFRFFPKGFQQITDVSVMSDSWIMVTDLLPTCQIVVRQSQTLIVWRYCDVDVHIGLLCELWQKWSIWL